MLRSLRLVLTVALTVAALASGAAAVMAGPRTPAASVLASPEIATGVLSPRRAPVALAEMVGAVRLEGAIEGVMRDSRFAEAENESCLIVKHRGTAIYAREPDRQVVPASTLKLVTAWAALKRFGANHRFVTEVRAPARPNNGVVERLWVVGGGDPLLATGAYAARFSNQPQIYTPIEPLADAIKAAGVTTVSAGVFGDDSRFDGERYLASWKEGYLLDSEVGPVAPLVVNDNFVSWGAKDVPAADPAIHAAGVMAALLRERGVGVGEPGGRQKVAPTSVVIAKVESPPMSAMTAEMLAESDNLTAEVFVKALGQAFGGGGSWPAGLQVIRETLSKAGYPGDAITQFDGSGLERDNRLSCALLLQVLGDGDVGAVLTSGLAVAGESGTLRTRLTEPEVKGKVRAKTGSLDFVAGLVGFADTRVGTVDFALVGNGLPRSARAGREFTDAIARVLVAYPDVPALDQLGPIRP